MKKAVRFAGYALLVVIILPIVIFFGSPLAVVFSGYAFPAPVHQEVENVACIEILDTSRRTTDEILYALDDSEIQPFMDRLLEMKSAKYVNDPADWYGDLTVRITYADGYVDMIGTEICAYRSPDGRNQTRGWPYVKEAELRDLIDDYVDQRD